jgi:hypothetical protein
VIARLLIVGSVPDKCPTNAIIAANGGFRGSLTGISIGADVTSTQKIWHSLQAFGDIAFAYSFSNILIEIQVSSKLKPSCSLL